MTLRARKEKNLASQLCSTLKIIFKIQINDSRLNDLVADSTARQ